MKQHIALTTIVVDDYDAAIAFYVGLLGFELKKDSYLRDEDKRWVVVTPPGAADSGLLLAKAVDDEQRSRIGNQTGGRVVLFLYTDDFWRDYERYKHQGVDFVRDPQVQSYGTVAVFRDLYGNLWDLLEPA
jgi:catechol 2,3-dioxygenase-like lactoylglutathione lyase family enzyme